MFYTFYHFFFSSATRCVFLAFRKTYWRRGRKIRKRYPRRLIPTSRFLVFQEPSLVQTAPRPPIIGDRQTGGDRAVHAAGNKKSVVRNEQRQML